MLSRRRLIYYVARCRRSVIKRVLHADDPPHRLALGVAIAMFVTLTPTVGFQSVLVILLATLFRANKLVGLPLVWISNPATFVPIYYPCYRIGLWITGGKRVSFQWWRELTRPPEDYLPAMKFYWSRLTDVIVPLTVGSVIVALPIAVASYALSYQAIVRYRHRRIFRRHRSDSQT